MKIPACPLALAILFTALRGIHAADYEGADSILKQIADRNSAAAAGQPAKNGDTPEKLKTDLEAFRKTAAALPPDEAASGWLDLADRFSSFPPDILNPPYEFETQRFDFSAVLAALPPPAAWPALAKAVEARPADDKHGGAYHAILLRLIAHRLTNDKPALNKDIDDLQEFLKKAASGNAYVAGYPDQLKSMLLEDADNGAEMLKVLDRSLSAPNPGGQPREITVPDLVTLVGNEKAADFLRRALGADAVIASITGDETTKLARKLALEMMADLKAPQWALTYSIDSTALFEAMFKRFGTTNGISDWRYNEARTYYLLGLIAAHRTKDAVAYATNTSMGGGSLPKAGIDALERAGLTNELADFLYGLLSKNPDLPFWDSYVAIAVKAGQEKKMVALAEASAARTGLNSGQHWQIEGYLSAAYLATDRVDDGLAILRKEIAAVKTTPFVIGEMMEARSRHSMLANDGAVQLGMQLAGIGAVLERKDLVDEGIQTSEDALKANRAAGENANAAQDSASLAALLIELDRGPEAEAVLKEALLTIPQNNSSYSINSQATECLSMLMEVYDRANRPADVLALLDHATLWGKKDLADIMTLTVTIDRNEEYVGYFAANALAATGKVADARKILDALMDQVGGYDPAYELLIKIAPHDEVLARLDALFARDKFEPRPLIWKAKVLLDAGKLEDAEAAARQAIAIDPSDGEHGPGRRMRAYSVLADIRAARGDNKEAEFYRGAVTAIRHSEDADRFYAAGLITRAIKMYEESLTHFADAYCIQSRLALRMAEIGDMAGAEEHYKRAYELMPDSFGRVESHCFGCERAFDGAFAQNIAEKVFTDLAKKRPDKPQVHYLLGYLRYEEGNYPGALDEFREAVKLDPEYLNAWKKIGEISAYGGMRVPAAELESVQLNILRLDPLGRHSNFDASKIIDLAGAWNALEAAIKLRPVKPDTLYPLTASAEELAKQEKEEAANPNRYNPRMAMYRNYAPGGDWQVYPGMVISRNQFLQTVAQNYFDNAMLNAGGL